MAISNEIKVGVLSLAGLVILYLGFNFLKGKSVLATHNFYTVLFDKIDGLMEGNPVLLNGFQVGSVEGLELVADGSGRVSASLSIQDEVPLPKGVAARIVSSGLMGDKQVILVAPKNTTTAAEVPLHQNGDTLIGELEVPLTTMLSEEVLPVKDKLAKMIDSLQITVNSINQTLNSGALQSSLASLQTTLQYLQKSSAQVNQLLAAQSGKIDGIVTDAAAITNNLKNNNDNINTIISNAQSTTQRLAQIDVQPSIAKLNGTLTQAESTIKQLTATIEKINSGEGSAALLLNDPKLYQNIEKTTRDLDALFVDMKNNPKRYVHFSVFGRKDKSAAGENNVKEE
ncbi:MAG: MCE family protein [Sphingobacteriales bacterium]|nr:MCE family protein [Sphingobacteriales bacterium]